MRPRILTQSMEAIAFQSTKFFTELIQGFEALWAQKYNLPYSKLIATPEAKALLECAKRHTKMTFFYSTRYENAGPAIISAPLNPNHIFFSEEMRGSHWFMDHFKEIYGKTRKEAVFGSVNLKEACVGGFFEEVGNELLLPTAMLASGKCYGEILTAEEAAAITLHEFGHAFTFFEYSSRLATGNQVLAYLSSKLSASDPQEYRVALVNADAVMNYTAEQRAVLEKAKDSKELAVLSVAVVEEKMRAELGINFYDITSCEQLADQFANRLGAGLALASALEKIGGLEAFLGSRNKYSIVGQIVTHVLVLFSPFYIGGLGVLFAIGMFVSLLLGVLIRGMPWYPYDDSVYRPIRIRQDMIERLKDRAITKEEKTRLVGNIEALDKLIATKSEYPALDHYLAILLKSSYRKAHDLELLQKQLESLASNSLFVKASKLETINLSPT